MSAGAAAKAAPTGTAVDAPAEAAPRRQDKRRARTRAQLLEAARRTMGEKGIDGVTVAEIAEAADVAFGSFYNHFESKDAILEALIIELIEAIGATIDTVIVEIDDSVEALAVAFRLMHRLADVDPSWGAFMVRASVSDDRLLDSLLARGRRDIERGVEAGRLHVPDLDVAVLMLAGAALFAARGRIDGRIDAESENASVELMLRLVGADPGEAAALAASPMPREVADLVATAAAASEGASP